MKKENMTPLEAIERLITLYDQSIAALKTERARQADKPGVQPRPVKDSPFAALAALTETPPARPRRRRPRRKAKA